MLDFFIKTILINDLENTAINDPIGGDIKGLILQIITYAIGIAGLVSIAFIVIGGFQYIMSQGNDETSKKAAQTLTYAVIGLIVVMASYAIVNTVLTKVLG